MEIQSTYECWAQILASQVSQNGMRVGTVPKEPSFAKFSSTKMQLWQDYSFLHFVVTCKSSRWYNEDGSMTHVQDGAYSWIAVASLFRSSSDFVRIK